MFIRRLSLSHALPPLTLMLGVALLGAAVTLSASVVHLDEAVGQAIRRADVFSTHTGSAISVLGGSDVVFPLTLACGLLLCGLRQWRGALTLLLAVGGTQVMVHLLKVTIERPRPSQNGSMAEASGFSFPSAHSATAMALYATLTFLAARRCSGMARTAIIAAGTSLVLAVGGSRVLLAAHHPTDVVAGWLTGGALIVASFLLVSRLGWRLPRAQPAA